MNPNERHRKAEAARVWTINGETVDPYALARVLPEKEPHRFVAGNHTTGCVLCGTSKVNAVHV